MNEAEVVMALDEGQNEDEVLIRYDLTHNQLDKIMAAHDRNRCPVCGHWWYKTEIINETCPDCR